MRALLVTCLTLLIALASGVAVATTVLELDFDQLVEASDLIVVGHVASVEGVEKDGRVWTHIAITVDETLKGTHQDLVKIVHIGGRTETLGTYVAGMPRFTVGEHALLFLEQPRGYDYFVVTGLAQGKMSVKADPSGQLKLMPNTVPMHTIRPAKLPTADAEVKPAPAAIVTLADARARITSLIRPKETRE